MMQLKKYLPESRKRVKVPTLILGSPIVRYHFLQTSHFNFVPFSRKALEHITEAVLIDNRIFRMEDDDWLEIYNLQGM